MTVDALEKALWAKCPACGHTWAAAYYPMELAKMARIAKAHSACPKCGSPGAVAKQNDGRLEE